MNSFDINRSKRFVYLLGKNNSKYDWLKKSNLSKRKKKLFFFTIKLYLNRNYVRPCPHYKI